MDKVPTSPDIARYNGKFYLSSYNETNLYVADHPMGPYRDLGPFKNTGTVDDGWNGAFDPQIFIDDDNTPYMFWGGRGISGIYGVRLDPDDLTRFAEKPTHLFGFNPMHSWERYGEAGEYPGVAWIEGPWVIKRNGIYYLEYSASGTQWNSYAEGYSNDDRYDVFDNIDNDASYNNPYYKTESGACEAPRAFREPSSI